jgi:peptidoglycan/xylan/chitin deacetylase (PgdA/CDA1 family)
MACGGSSADPESDPEHISRATDLFEEAWRDNNGDKADADATCSGAKPPDQGPFDKRVALTFDDGPNPATTPQVIATLRARGIPATFFVNGWRVDGPAARAVLDELAAEPLFKVGNHTWWHDDMRTLSASRRAKEIDDTRELIASTGEPLGYFRFPYGASSCTTAAEVRARGYKITGWHVDSADWCFQSGGGYCPASTFAYVPDAFRGDMLGYTMSQIRAHKGGIVLFHDIHPNTVAHLDALLDELVAEGYAFVGLDDDGAFPLLNGAAPSFIGDACESADDCGVADGVCLGAESGAGRCSKACSASCPDAAGYPLTRCVALGDPDEAGGDADIAMNLCAVQCGPGGSCPDGLACTSALSPTGVARDVCW